MPLALLDTNEDYLQVILVILVLFIVLPVVIGVIGGWRRS